MKKIDWRRIGSSWVPYTIAACSAVLLYVILTNLGAIWNVIRGVFRFLSPVLWGIVIAYIIDALVRPYQKFFFRKRSGSKAARNVSIGLALFTILLVVALFAGFVIPQVAQSISSLVVNVGSYASSLGSLLESANISVGHRVLDMSLLLEYSDQLLNRLVSFLQENAGTILNTSFSVGKGFFNLIISFILAIYFLLDKDRLLLWTKKMLHLWLPDNRYSVFSAFCLRSNRILLRFIGCDLLDALVVAIANFIFQSIFGMPYAVLISFVVGLCNLVPTFGPIVGWLCGGFILLLVNPWSALWFTVFTLTLQTIDGYILKPKLFGDTLGVSSLWILVVIIVGGRMFGMAGVLLAIPFAAISDYLVREVLRHRIRAKHPAYPSSPDEIDTPAE